MLHDTLQKLKAFQNHGGVFFREYQVCQANLEVRETLEIKELLENQGEMVKMEPVDPKGTLANQVHKECREDKVEMVWLGLLVQLVPWWKEKRFQGLLDNQVWMVLQDLLERQV